MIIDLVSYQRLVERFTASTNRIGQSKNIINNGLVINIRLLETAQRIGVSHRVNYTSGVATTSNSFLIAGLDRFAFNVDPVDVGGVGTLRVEVSVDGITWTVGTTVERTAGNPTNTPPTSPAVTSTGTFPNTNQTFVRFVTTGTLTVRNGVFTAYRSNA